MYLQTVDKQVLFVQFTFLVELDRRIKIKKCLKTEKKTCKVR